MLINIICVGMIVKKIIFKKTELRDVAYQSRKSFEQNWINVSEQVKKYLRGAE